ncbi:hypothetical protein ACV3R5_14895 [Clostridium perfringens]
MFSVYILMNEGKIDFENLGVVFNIFNCESKKDILEIKRIIEEIFE